MANILVPYIDPATGVTLYKRINEWQHALWDFANSVSHTEASDSIAFLQFCEYLLKADKEIEEAQKIDPNVEYEAMPAFINAVNIVRDTDGFYTFADLSLPQALLLLDKKISKLHTALKQNPHNNSLFLELDELVEEQNDLVKEIAKNKSDKMKSLPKAEKQATDDCGEDHDHSDHQE